MQILGEDPAGAEHAHRIDDPLAADRSSSAHVCTGPWAHPLPHRRRDWAHPLPHRHWDWARPSPHLHTWLTLCQTYARAMQQAATPAVGRRPLTRLPCHRAAHNAPLRRAPSRAIVLVCVSCACRAVFKSESVMAQWKTDVEACWHVVVCCALHARLRFMVHGACRYGVCCVLHAVARVSPVKHRHSSTHVPCRTSPAG